MTDMIAHPPHYRAHPSGIEVIRLTRLLPFGPGSAVKYVMRRDHKDDPVTDLGKAIWYLQDSLDHDVTWECNSETAALVTPVIEADSSILVRAFLSCMYVPYQGAERDLPDIPSSLYLIKALRSTYLQGQL